MRPRFACPQKKGRARPSREGAGKTGCALHPRSRVQICAKKRTRAYRFSGGNPAFPAQWLYGLLRALPGDRLCCHRHKRDAKRHRRLDASVGASGPHDFAVRVSIVVCAQNARHAAASTASRPTFVAIAIRPSFGPGRPRYASDLGSESRVISENRMSPDRQMGDLLGRVKLSQLHRHGPACPGHPRPPSEKQTRHGSPGQAR